MENILENYKKAIIDGKYRIEIGSSCMCTHDWTLIGDNRLDYTASGDDCWVCSEMQIDNNTVILRNQYDSMDAWAYKPLSPDQHQAQLALIDWIYDEMPEIATEMDGDDIDNDIHNDRKRDALIDFIIDNGYGCRIDHPRDFANEYTCVLIEGGQATQEDAEAWADSYLANGDDATKMYIGFSFEDY